jgi:S-adenosylmethionine:tRNA ribosyltransferase-isomerase
MPSAGYHLRLSLVREMQSRGIGLATLTHAAGISATGDPAIDAMLPLTERFEIPASSVAAIENARRGGHRTLAVGTTVLRALEGCSNKHAGRLVPGPGVTDLLVGPDFRLRVVDGLLTGFHERDSSHFRLLQSLVPTRDLDRAYALAKEMGIRWHELGDVSLVWSKHPS